MKAGYFLTFLALILPICELKSQETGTVKFADEMPLFQNDDTGQNFLSFIYQNLDLSNVKDYEKGRVIVQFIVKSDSAISDVKILKGINIDIDSSIIRVIHSSPKWTPGKKQGKEVNVILTFPVDIDFH